MNVIEEIKHTLLVGAALSGGIPLEEVDRIMATPTTGGVGCRRTGDLPAGWVNVDYFITHDAETTEYHGPVLFEDDRGIRIEVGGESLTFPKSRVIITRSEQS